MNVFYEYYVKKLEQHATKSNKRETEFLEKRV